MAQRIKGLEISLNFSSPVGDEKIENILSAEVDMDISLLEEEYLGDSSKSYDDIFNGFKGKCDFHMSDETFVKFQMRVQDRAMRRDPAGGKFSVTMSHIFPSGKKVRLTYEDIFFGSLPTGFGSRREYVKGTINWGCSRCTRVF